MLDRQGAKGECVQGRWLRSERCMVRKLEKGTVGKVEKSFSGSKSLGWCLEMEF